MFLNLLLRFDMFLHGLKTNIVINLAMLLGLAMILIDLVVIVSVERILINSEISKGYLLISAIENNYPLYSQTGSYRFRTRGQGEIIFHKENCDKIMEQSGFTCAVVLDKNFKQKYFYGKNCILQSEFEIFAKDAIRSGKKTTKFLGTTWGVFWKQRESVIISAPLFCRGNIVAGASIALQLEGIYLALRRIQTVISAYIILNTLILAFAGLYRISKLTVKPLHRLLERAEEYKDDTEIFFLGEKESNEFNQLSKALNRMLQRISDDKDALLLTVRSLKKANADLKQAQKDIIRAEKLASVGRLSAGIAHEIGNPIAIVIGYLELLKRKDVSDDEKNEFIARTENEINRINIIIRQLLDFSRPSDGELKSVSVHEVINDIANVLKFQPLMSDIDLTLSLTAEKDSVMADPNQLRQVFLNLIINAADAISSVQNKSDCKLIITSGMSDVNDDCEVSPGMLKIMCIDNGPGIPGENLSNIFDPFYTTKEPGKGTGLGLSVSFTIVESVGGKIKALSEEGKGTTMVIYLPIED